MNKLVVWLIYLSFWWNKKHETERDDVLRRAARRYWFRVDSLIKLGLFATAIFIVLIVVLSFGETCGLLGCENRFVAFLRAPANEIGDTLAGIAGGLAFLWLVVTVLLQGKELAAQRDELVAHRQEFETMNTTMELQRFDNTFFAALEGLETAIRDIDLNSKKHGPTVGRDCFRVFYTRLKTDFRDRQSKDHPADLALELAYRAFWNSHQLELSQYFRVLENVLRLIGEQKSEHKRVYFDIVRFRLSDQELLLTYYHIISGVSPALRELSIQAVLFEQLPTVRLLEYEHFKKIDAKAFGNNPLKDASAFRNPVTRRANETSH